MVLASHVMRLFFISARLATPANAIVVLNSISKMFTTVSTPSCPFITQAPNNQSTNQNKICTQSSRLENITPSPNTSIQKHRYFPIYRFSAQVSEWIRCCAGREGVMT